MSTQLSDKDVADIKALFKKWCRLFVDADWEGLAGLLTDDIVFMPPDEPVAEGKQAVRAWVEAFIPIKEYSVHIVCAEGRDDFAWIRATFAVTGEPEPGKSISLKGKATATLRRQPNGSWLVASDIWNFNEPLAAG